MSPIERAAEAMFVALRGTNELACCGKWSAERFAEYTGRHEEGWVYIDGPIKLDALVRAVLQAYREPSEGMIEAGDDAIIYHPEDIICNQAKRCWPAMINHALSE